MFTILGASPSIIIFSCLFPLSHNHTVVDLADWGHNGVEPMQLVDMRQFIQENEPDVYSLAHQDDPMIKRYIDDPTQAIRDAEELMKSAQTSF